MKKLFLAFALLGLICVSTLTAQKVFTGTIEYEITYPGTELDPMTAAMLPTSSILTFGPNKCKVIQATGGMTSVVIVDGDNSMYYVLIAGMGQKIMAKDVIDTEELNKNKPEMMIHDGDIKTIAGYECVKTDVIIKEGSQSVTFTGYFNSEIYNPTYAFAGNFGTEGIPLEMTIDLGNVKMKMTAKKVKQSKIKDSEFAIPEGYMEVPIDALQNLGM